MYLETTATFQPSRPALFVTAGVLLLAAFAGAQDFPHPPAADTFESPATPSFDVQTLPGLPVDEVLFDEPGDGALWARGTSYKARFDGRGATYIPFFGAEAPRNYPLAFEVRSVNLDGAPLAAWTQERTLREGNVVRIDHGSFVEEYELAPSSLEQRFVFASLPTRGELTLTIGIDTELDRQDLGRTLRFANELGHVDYSEAFAIDARGARIELDSSLVDGAIELRVPADFVELAVFPLVVDPFVTAFTVAGGTRHELLPDVSYDATTDRWCVAYVDIWSAIDYDVYVRLVTGSGTLLSTLTIDFTSNLWTTPAIANSNYADTFLLAAAVVPASGVADIRGRFVMPATATVGAVIQISPLDGAYRNIPDVGGAPHPTFSIPFCVVWQRFVTPDIVNIESRSVSVLGGLGPIQTLSTNGGLNQNPSIASSIGTSTGDGTEAWTVAWQYRFNPWDYDIKAAQVSWTGSIAQPEFLIDGSALSETRPVVSTMLDSTGTGQPRTYMVAYERDWGSDFDVLVRVLQGTTIGESRNIVGDLDSAYWYWNQLRPSIDSDGKRILIAFEEIELPANTNSNVFVSTYDWVNGALIPCEVRADFAGSLQFEGEVAVHSMASTGGPRTRYFGAWTFGNGNGDFDVQGGLWDACDGEPGDPFCFGDGSGNTCPCNNPGAAGHGCRNGFFASGARLEGQGSASVALDTLVLVCSNARPNQAGLFFQGSTGVNGGQGVPYGDGLRCAGGFVTRLQTIAANSSGVATSTIDIAAHTGITPGFTRFYQYWYRDPNLSPCGTGFNLSNGYRVLWQL